MQEWDWRGMLEGTWEDMDERARGGIINDRKNGLHMKGIVE